MKNYAVPTAYHCDDDNITSTLHVYFITAENPEQAKILTKEIVIKEELILDPDEEALPAIWFENAIEGIDNEDDEEGIIIGEPKEIPNQPITFDDVTHPDGNQSNTPYWVRKKLADIDEQANALIEYFEGSEEEGELYEEFIDTLNDLQNKVTEIQEFKAWI